MRLLAWPTRILGYTLIAIGFVGAWGLMIGGVVYGIIVIARGDPQFGLAIMFLISPPLAYCAWVLTKPGEWLVELGDYIGNRKILAFQAKWFD